jgi:cold shock CspA family protein
MHLVGYGMQAIMKGTIKTYLPEKRYGFIKGDDGRDYFFHENEFPDGSQIGQLCEEAFVNFDQRATPKGYEARNCSLIDPSEVLTYAVPDEFIASRSDRVRGWQIIEFGHWIVHGTSRDSPDSARRAVMDSATRVGANALIELEYYKTTGSEAGTGRGTHHFTIHHFRGRVVTLAKRTSRGSYRADQLSGLNQRAESLKKKLVEQTQAKSRLVGGYWPVTRVDGHGTGSNYCPARRGDNIRALHQL